MSSYDSLSAGLDWPSNPATPFRIQAGPPIFPKTLNAELKECANLGNKIATTQFESDVACPANASASFYAKTKRGIVSASGRYRGNPGNGQVVDPACGFRPGRAHNTDIHNSTSAFETAGQLTAALGPFTGNEPGKPLRIQK